MASSRFKIGDVVFFAIAGIAGEAMFIGYLKGLKDVLMLVVGKQFVELDAEVCSPTRRGMPAEGESWRRAHLKEHPGTLV